MPLSEGQSNLRAERSDHSWFQSEYEPLQTGREEEKKKKIFNLFLSV